MRDAIIIIAVGKIKVGKTFTTLQQIVKYVNGNPQTGKVGRKVLIYDANMEYTQYKAIALKDLKRFTMQKAIEVRRVLPRLPDGRIATIDEMMTIMAEILESFAGGLLVLEDINRYMIGTQTQEIIGTLATNRHRDLDIIIHLQSAAAITTRMFQNCAFVRFHKQMDSIDRYRNRIPYFEVFKIAQILVDNKYDSGDIRFYCYVSGENGFIRGNFSKKDFREACERYAVHYSENLRIYINDFGKVKDARQKAIEKVTSELEKKYYGNK